MRVLLQRVTQASVAVADETIAEIGPGLLAFVGVFKGDTAEDAQRLATKGCELRIFGDDDGKMNRSIIDAGGAILAVSQFTLAADCTRGRRPSFDPAAPPEEASALYESFCAMCREEGVEVRQGTFAAHMRVALVNDGPVTILLDSRERRA